MCIAGIKTVLIDSGDDFFAAACAVPLQNVTTKVLAAAGVELLVRRDDLLDKQLSGNKFYKLFFNLHEASKKRISTLLSFGGAYSNHLHALAAAGQRYGFRTIGVVRGERPAQLNPTLADAEKWGMQLVFISRKEYGDKHESPIIDALHNQFGEFYSIPEGGANLAGAQGMQLLGRALEQQVKADYTAVCLPCGTGTSLAGLAAGISQEKQALGFSCLKGDGNLGGNIAHYYRQLFSDRLWVDAPGNWRLISGFHAGGYAKRPPDYLFRFWHAFEQETGLLLDPVYTLKMFWAIHCLAQQGYWARGSRVIAIHTGGLQGRRGFTCPEPTVI